MVNYEIIDIIRIENNIIEKGSIDDVIKLAKNKYNIHVPNRGKLYTEMCNKIKARLDREGLSYEIVRPE